MKAGTAINRTANRIIGKEVFKDCRTIEVILGIFLHTTASRIFFCRTRTVVCAEGEDKEFTLNGNTISVSRELDACIKYRPFFKKNAEYYTSQFKFKYQNCVQDFDSLLHYFEDMYLEGLTSMASRAYSLLLPFGVFTTDVDTFISCHTDRFNRAITSFEIMSGIEVSKNQKAEELGNQIGGAIQMQGGGFGFKGAMKGVAQAEAFNLGMNLFGKFVAFQSGI